MKKVIWIICIVVIILCIQVTFARYYTKEPTGNIKMQTGQAIIDLEQVSISSDEYEETTDTRAVKKPCLYDIYDHITYTFKVKNHNNAGKISDVDLRANVYVVFLDKDNKIIKNLDCVLQDSEENKIEDVDSVLTQAYTITVNEKSVTLPEGTYKFSLEDLYKAKTKTENEYDLIIGYQQDTLPTSRVISNMKMYCEAGQLFNI